MREATEEANRRRHDSISEATARVQEATDEAHRRVREATEEANRRVTQAGKQVEALAQLRNGLAQQLRSARTALQDIAPLLDPLDVEKEHAAAKAEAQAAPVPTAPAQAKPAEQPKPAGQAKPVEQPKPVDAKQAEAKTEIAAPVGETVDLAKPADAKPADAEPVVSPDEATRKISKPTPAANRR